MIIWLASYPKSGNTWLRFYILSLLMGKRTDLNLNHLKAIKESTMLLKRNLTFTMTLLLKLKKKLSAPTPYTTG